jgi:hypothetical protein
MIENQTVELRVDPKILTQILMHKAAQALSRDLPGWWHGCVVDGTGDNQTYQEGDTIKPYAASNESIERVNAPRTPKGSAALIPKATGGPPPKKKAETGFGSYLRGQKHRSTTRSNFQTNSL